MRIFPARGTLSSASLLSVAALAVVLLVGGCSGDDPATPDSSGDNESSSAAAGAADTLVAKGLQQLAAGKDGAAKATFENVLTIDPENLFGWYNLGLIAQRAGDGETAIENYDKALVIQSDYVPALYNKAIQVETRDLDEAIQLYRQVISIDDQVAAAYMRLGFALVHQGKTDEGQDFLAQGIVLDPAMAKIDAPSYD